MAVTAETKLCKGFELLNETVIPEIASTARLFRHTRTGAQILSLTNADKNKAFGVNFQTLPSDHTGVAHILEHAVLSGSRKYPVKELFVELLKGSCATFINAMTYPDKTCYPVASTNLKDFYNLIDVYLDVVLHPLLESHTLDQEGWHYELESTQAPLTYKGVVFNEMKGVYAMQDAVIDEEATKALMPDTIYALSSGGDPQHIPELTHEAWRGFHKQFYHPSNARIFFWGDDPEAERLAIIDRALADFDKAPEAPPIKPQSRFEGPRHGKTSMPAAATAAAEGRGALSVGWLLSEGPEIPERRLAWAVLHEILVGTSASPLKKALLDSGLGEDLIEIFDEMRQRVFITGLKGVTEAGSKRVEPLIIETLEGLAKNGVDPATIEASINSLEFALRENNSPYRGISAMLAALRTWNYGSDPIAALAFEAPLAALKKNLAANPHYFEAMIREAFIDNPHRSVMWHAPDANMLTQQETQEKQRLAKLGEKLSPADRQRIAAETAELKRRQEQPNSPEQLARLPQLRIVDLDRKNTEIPRAVAMLGGRPLIHHDIGTNGIAYVDLAFDLHALPVTEMALVPVLARAMVELGTDKYDEIAMSQRIARHTGGVSASPMATGKVGGAGEAAWLFVRGKATVAKTPELLAIFKDILVSARLDQKERFKRLVLEEKAQIESGLVMSGNRYCSLRLKARTSAAGYATELMDGVSQLMALRQLAADIDADWPTALKRLNQIREALINRGSALLNVTLDAISFDRVRLDLERLIAALPERAFKPLTWTSAVFPAAEGLIVPTQVNYVAKGADARPLGFKTVGSSLAINRWLSLAWLIPKIREQGGAYGASFDVDLRTGELAFTSYRDPNVLSTLETYDGTGDFLRGLSLSQTDLTRSIVGAINRIDPYQLPGAQGFTSLTRYLVGQTEDARQKLRDELFATSPDDFRTFAGIVDGVRDQGAVVIMGGADKLAEANQAKGGNWLTLTTVH